MRSCFDCLHFRRSLFACLLGSLQQARQTCLARHNERSTFRCPSSVVCPIPRRQRDGQTELGLQWLARSTFRRGDWPSPIPTFPFLFFRREQKIARLPAKHGTHVSSRRQAARQSNGSFSNSVSFPLHLQLPGLTERDDGKQDGRKWRFDCARPGRAGAIE